MKMYKGKCIGGTRDGEWFAMDRPYLIAPIIGPLPNGPWDGDVSEAVEIKQERYVWREPNKWILEQ
jgi:hypothetical protein